MLIFESKADIFGANSRDGVHSHGLNRFPVFISYVRDGLVKPDAEPICLDTHGCIEHWDGQLGAGMYNATIANRRAMALAEIHGFGCVTLKNTNHWMRGGTYGWQAADAGFIGICFTNTIAGIPAWGGSIPVLGNNPFVIAVPRSRGHVVLDMAMSQFSYGKMQEHQLKGEPLPVFGGYDDAGQLTTDPAVIRKNKRALPMGYWKGAGMSMILDILLVALSGGKSTEAISAACTESGLSQCFICIKQPHLHDQLVEDIINYTRTSAGDDTSVRISYPGEGTLRKRMDSEKKGVLVNEIIWEQVQGL
jgi:3-dehydro-L-gulonate 2-dehydrogenase